MRKRSIKKGILMLWFIVILSLVSTSVVEAVLMSVKISGNLVPGGKVNSFSKLSPDGKYTVFFADAINYQIQDLFSVPSAGGTRVLLSPGMNGLVMVKGFIISPDSQRVVFWVGPPSADNQITGVYSVAITGGSVINLSGILSSLTLLEDIAISSNNQHVVLTIRIMFPDEPVSDILYLWSVSLLGGNKVTLQLVLRGGDLLFQITPDGEKIVFILGPPDVDPTLWRINMSGENKEQLAGDNIIKFAITADGNRVVYTKIVNTFVNELYSVSINGGESVKLNRELVADGSVIDFKVSPDPNSDYVVYRADEVVKDQDEIFSVLADGSGSRVRLLDGIVKPYSDVRDYRISPNGLGVVYNADVLSDERFDLGSVSITGGTHNWLNGAMVAGGQSWAFSISPDSSKVVFIADKYTLDENELFVVTITGTNLTKLNADLPLGGDVNSFLISPNNQFVVYYSDQEKNDDLDLFLAGGGMPPIKLSNLSNTGGGVYGYDITSDSKGVIYRADQDTYEKWELFSVFDRFPVYVPLILR
jgi:Tol biopolymer transport system component